MPPGWTEQLAQALLESEELARYESLRKDVIQRTKDAFDSGVAKADMAEAVKDLFSNSDTTVIEYWFPSWEDSETFMDDWWDAYHDLIEAFPELLANADIPESDDLSGGGSCAITDELIDDFFVDNFDSYYEYYFSGDAEIQSDHCEEDTPEGEGHDNDECDEEHPATYCGTWGDFARASGCTLAYTSAGLVGIFGGLAGRTARLLVTRVAARLGIFGGVAISLWSPIECQCEWCT